MPKLEHILVATDFSPCSDAALEYAIFLAGKVGAKLHVLHVWEVPVGIGVESLQWVALPDGGRASLTDFVRGEAEKELALLRDKLDKRGLRLETHLVAGDAARVVIEKSKDYDLLIMGTHGRTAVAHFLLGSVAERVVRKATVPVLTFRSADGGSL
jgi:universal stress protein A